jgi:subtilisin family serine protease
MRRLLIAAVAGALAVLACTGAAATPPVEPEPDDTPPTIRSQEFWLKDQNIQKAWKVTKGEGVRIAVIDTGIGRTDQLDPAVVGGTDESAVGSSDGRTPVGTLDANHGSWVASLAAARDTTSDHTGMIGVAPKAELLSISVGFEGVSPVPFTDQLAKAMRWAVDHGAKVINLSLTTNTLDWDTSWDDAFLYAFEHDVVVVVAAGNRGNGTDRVGAPATIPGVLTVAGVDPSGHASVEASTQGITIGVSAPSEQLLGVSADGEVVIWKGTSGAAPIVAGIAALVRAAHPELNAANVIERIVKTAKPAPGMTQVPSPLYGYGIVDAAAAVSADVPLVSGGPADELKDWIRVYRRAVSGPQPTPTETPVVVPPLPRADAVTQPISPLLPTRDRVMYGTLPLMAVTLPAILVGLGVTVAARRIRSARSSRTPRRQNP